MKKSTLLPFLIIFSLVIVSATSGKPSLKHAQKVLDGFCSYVPSGNAVIEDDTLSVQSFYMSKTEITNIQYREFLHALRKKGDLEKLALAQVDSLAWNTKLGYSNAAYASYYHNHPAYNDYPVVNISAKGAELYCEWLSEVYDSISNGGMKVKFRIPTRAEYMRAARGDHHYYQFAWGGPYLQNVRGQHLANHLQVGEQNIQRNLENGKLEIVSRDKILYDVLTFTDNADVTAPAKSYWPNDFGFYNLNGNVSEMISDAQMAVGGDWNSPGYDIRNESIKKFDGQDPRVGFRVVVTYSKPK